jgi:hypothetical protein
MRGLRIRFPLKSLMILVVLTAIVFAGLRAWRRQVYCSGWASVWAINEQQMLEQAAAARTAHDEDRAASCEARAAGFSRLKQEYKRTAGRFWEPLPTDAPRPLELR